MSYITGDQVEAIKWTDDVNEWYCARVVDTLNKTTDGEPLVFVHYEGWPPDEADWISPTLVRPRTKHSPLRFGPRGQESDQSWKDYATFCSTQAGLRIRQHTGLVHDRRMVLHCCPCHSRETVHPERPDRIASILQTLHNQRLLRYLRRIHAREATLEELLLVHTPTHVRNYFPMDSEKHASLITNEPPRPSPQRMTSIAAILNHPSSPPPSPSRQTRPRHGSIVGPTRGVGGGVVVQADQDHIEQQHRRFSNAAASADASQSDPAPISPPDLVCKMTCGELGIAVDTTFHPLFSSLSARVAVGALLQLVDHIVQGHLRNGFALIRPPGHHAEDDNAMGFCFFNNVAVSVLSVLQKYPSTMKKVLIVDWDVHHGNGTQKIFYDNPNVLYISLHRWDRGQFYPFSGAPDECGEGAGLGRNVNIAFSGSQEKPKPMGDTEFIAAFYHILIPIARQFSPDMIFVSAGFDAAEGHPDNLGGYKVTPRGFALMTRMVKDLAEELCDGRLVLTLEGGYALEPLADAAAASVAQLLPAEVTPPLQFAQSLNAIKLNQGAVESLRQVAEIHSKYWELPSHLLSSSFRFHLPAEWRARDGLSTRPRRDKKARNVLVAEGY
ncbi:Histone deacetylase 4 [Apophysomyces sp. BC1034]|nr:Histone deacetylase 4 [Apophysomyces sp. BC1015]KAG0183064.1 Histone deacetylase 4 [Apophysomyces sp. BC1021]KAG0194810.1 Histone deacetylase 4 [Apophysomyces sp. BC1034]